jgi:hypothetical protein
VIPRPLRANTQEFGGGRGAQGGVGGAWRGPQRNLALIQRYSSVLALVCSEKC